MKAKTYTSQRNYCVSLLTKTKKNYYNSLNEKDVSDNKTFLENGETFSFGQDILKRVNLVS